ncbi:MAG TPA: S-layer homology domain-containing protein [Nostocaceae cyanobacterium]|nr:S-layer homology domain-containing protein [Nostocaceae cyanobacterium]
MLSRKHPAIFLGLAVLLSSLTACANSPAAKNLEQALAADPQLKDNPAVFGKDQNQRSPKAGVSPSPTAGASSSSPNPTPKVELPSDFPQDIPIYPNAKLVEVKPVDNSQNQISTRWQSAEPSNFIASFYRSQFPAKNWQILQQPTDDVGSFEVKRDNSLVKVTIQPQQVTQAAPDQPQTATELLIQYTPNTITTQAPNQPSPASSPTTQPTTQPATSTTQEFSDLNKIPAEWRLQIRDLAALGVLSLEPNTTKNNSTTTANQLEPNKIITRRQYARWLVAANNAMYANNPAKKIRLAAEGTQGVFKDVSATDPDFPVIQGLAEAGLIPSPLSGDATALLFRPDAPLTREQLLLWKVPLDSRQGLPAANLEAVKQSWGFQDAEKIDPKALRAVLADYQNGEQSNIRRVFGYTTLFQPKKPVTRAEAAAALWYFGSQGEGISATEALKLKS